MLAPFYIAATDGGFDGTLDIPQHITAALADRRTQCIDSIRGRKIVNCLKIVPVKITLWFKTAPFQNGVHDADCGGTLELEFLSGIIIIHQERPVNDGEDVCAVVVPVGFCQLSGNVRNLLAEPFMVNAVFLRQHFRYRLEQVIVELPHLRVTGIAAHSGVRHIKHIVQTRVSAGFVQQGDALGATPDIPVHAVVPDVVIGAGCGIGSLGVDHKLVRKGVLVQPGCGGQVVCPAFPVPGQAVGCALGKGEIFFGFAWHFGLLPFLSIKIAGNRFGAARWKVY
ncbi:MULTISPECIES: hypothetical protein [Faecalibacterium]|uniref:hypothetical protein n=1 Tax=Faecalibacterium TaxID=216851 RepID=UPI001D0EB6AE|nr:MULTISPECIES: hypothetical protein [Faecalibacterium]MBS6926652.1 hypothetical protein [Faecalibacterium prausnitzii]MCC2124072.1 hypothetical protein [Faecalibacterium hominis (ex Afrizal et al. 2022)]MDV5042725.1 hypothetical protein [Faecalibacterium duncaniae]HJI00194.1 hypothetical protein [Faecalibacterium prausnitzii]HJI02355.1 hypothetical protein [Faecalibacterium prausnitzii]